MCVKKIVKLSPLATLGYKAHVALVNGDPLGDELLNDIFIHEIRSLPHSSRWILDDYPTTVEQARVTESQKLLVIQNDSLLCVFLKIIFSALSEKSISRPRISREFILIGGSKRDKSVRIKMTLPLWIFN